MTTALGAPAATAGAQPGNPSAAAISDAARAVEGGEYQRAVDLVSRLLPLAGSSGNPGGLDAQDRAEAWRIYGLALFFLERRSEAEKAFLEYLELDVDARLDPALVPPEAIVFFEDVRSRHAAELRKYRPEPGRKPSWALNLIPVAGQFQNRHRTKGIVIAGTGAVLLATNLTTFFLLRSWCDSQTGVCMTNSGESRVDEARTLRTVNILSGALLVGVAAYSIIDGFIHFGSSASRVSVGIAPTMSSGAQMVVQGRF